MSNHNSLRKNTALLTVGTALNKGLQFVVIVLFSRWVSTEAYGMFDLFSTYVSLLLPMISFSLDEAVFRNCIDTHDEKIKKGYVTNALVHNLFNLAVCVCLILLFAGNDDRQICFCIYLSGEVFSQYLRGYLRGMKRLDIYTLSLIVNTLIMAVSVTVLVYVKGYGIEGMLLGYAAGAWIGNLLVCVYGNWFKMLSFVTLSWNITKEMMLYSFPLIPNALSWWVMNASDRQIINLFFGNTANGIYAVSHKLPAMCSVVFNMFNISWQQETALRIRDKDRNEYFNQIFNQMIEVLAIVCSGLLAGSFILYHYIFDERYIEAQLYSPIMIVAAALMALSQFYGGIQMALREAKKNGITTVVGAVVNIIVHLLLVQWIGLFAAAVSTLVGNFVILMMRKAYIRKEFIGKMDIHNVWMLLALLYFFVMSYFTAHLGFNILNLALACLLALCKGKTVLVKLLRKEN